MPNALRIVISGGGTGGHVFPGIALADALVEAEPSVSITWVGTRGRVEETAVPRAGYPIEFVDVAFLHGTRGAARLRAAARLPRAGAQALGLLRRLRPDAVVGVGGFASGPIGAVAAASGVPLFVLEQNAVVGRTNRLLSRLARCAYATFDGSVPQLHARRVETLGNPVRAALREVRPMSEPHRPVRVLVVGGSQGARALNAAMPTVIAALAPNVPVEVRHAAGPRDAAAVTAAYAAAGVDAVVDPFIDDMAAAYAWTDLVVTRAGATTVAELGVVGRPAVLVPFPSAADDHQTANADAVERAGAGVRVAEPSLLAIDPCVDTLRALLSEPGRLTAMARAAAALGRPDAAARIAEDILQELR
ncbi:MAG: undecaprenyldiphospho-muramoylpentapeptide beta-N-acetylglucosaminyltransferase [Myxococcales bacterium]|nr:undecaprenyldiphospho-muramoylpentapeptide beta-N-acetylglucosaminyltransferase [Myxococcales bacterium]